MSRLIKRFHTQKGESLIETLVSILIVAISSSLLLGAISGAAKINREVRAGDDIYRTNLNIAEQGNGTIDGEVIIRIPGEPTYRYDVSYAGDVDKLRSYDIVKVVTPP